MKRCRLLAVLPAEVSFARAVVGGITDYCQPRGVELVFASVPFPPTANIAGQVDAIVALITSDEIFEQLREWRRPIVNVSSRLAPSWAADLAHVLPDNRAIGARAAEHLLGRGLRKLAFCGLAGHWYSAERQAGVVAAAEAQGGSVDAFAAEAAADPQYRELKQWLSHLPRPCGIVCANDQRARLIIDFCHAASIPVPDEIAVVGADNDDIYCRLANPPLTSVDVNANRIGQQAAEFAIELAGGKAIPDAPVLIPPRDVIVRRSSDTMAFADADIVEAMRFIQEHADRGIEVEDVLRQIPVSRRSLERRFLKIVGRTPYQEICRVRMERAKRLLAETNTPVAQIAGMLGFNHVQHLGMMFKRVTGVQPSAYRKLHRNA